VETPLIQQDPDLRKTIHQLTERKLFSTAVMRMTLMKISAGAGRRTAELIFMRTTILRATPLEWAEQRGQEQHGA